MAWTYRSAHHHRRDRSIVRSFVSRIRGHGEDDDEDEEDVRRTTVARTKKKKKKKKEEEEEEETFVSPFSWPRSFSPCIGGHERALLSSVRLQLNEEEFLFNEHPSRATGSYCPALRLFIPPFCQFFSTHGQKRVSRGPPGFSSPGDALLFHCAEICMPLRGPWNCVLRHQLVPRHPVNAT